MFSPTLHECVCIIRQHLVTSHAAGFIHTSYTARATLGYGPSDMASNRQTAKKTLMRNGLIGVSSMGVPVPTGAAKCENSCIKVRALFLLPPITWWHQPHARWRPDPRWPPPLRRGMACVMMAATPRKEGRSLCSVI